MFYTSKQTTSCTKIRASLSEYHDASLSARSIIEMEKHLAVCAECSEASREMEAMIRLLRAAPKRDTAEDFMLNLHNRLDALEPATSPALSLPARLRESLLASFMAAKAYRTHAVGFSLAGAIMIGVFAMRLPAPPRKVATPDVIAEPRGALAMPLEQNAVNATEDPFSDPVANRLEMHALLSTGNQASSARP